MHTRLKSCLIELCRLHGRYLYLTDSEIMEHFEQDYTDEQLWDLLREHGE